MPTWTIPAAAATGIPVPSSFGNDVIGDLELLAASCQVLAVNGSVPTTPTVKVASFRGAISYVTAVGGYSLNFPVAFPSSCSTFQMTVESSTPIGYGLSFFGPTGANFTLYTSAGELASGTYVVNFIAFGQ